MKTRYLIPLVVVGLSLTLPVSVMGQERVDLSTLVKRGDQYLVPGSLDPYTGPVVRYWSRSVIREWGQLRNGYLHGPSESYYQNGQLRHRGSYSNGKRDGLFERYQRNGQLSSKGTYSNGEPNGPWEYYYENGQLFSTGSYSNGEKCGEWIEEGETKTYPPCPNG